MKATAFIVLILVTLSGCMVCKPAETNVMSRKEVIEIARHAIRQERPEWADELNLEPIVTDKEGYWEVTFKVPEKEGYTALGGVPVVCLEKTTMKVIRLYHTQ